MTTSTVPADRSRLSVGRTVGVLSAAAVVAVLVNSLVVLVATRAGVDPAYPPITLPVYGAFSALGVVVGWLGWRAISRRARRPRRALTMLVPIVLVASFIPDVLLATMKFIPGTTTGAALTLMAMHVVVAAVAVPAYLMAGPVRD
ncbi:DUF6069 family protein [Propionicimonas sp.]|uniref:DUF6069 family protein n=1 Tax=Propionicimonas sp. TaxID=1955623 RepID=UPI0039E37078